MTSPPASFVHVVLTRFNTLVGYGTDPGRRVDPGWLVERFRLFDRFCYPSARAQTAAFRWLVFFDADTPDAFRRRIASYGLLTPVYVEGRLTDERIAALVAEHVALDATHLITTRLDNDDAMGDGYVARVQEAFRGQELQFVNVPLGYQWHDGRLYHRVDRANTFISLIERAPAAGEAPRTVHCAPHTDIRDVAPVRQVYGPPLWLVAIHGGNATNELLGIRRASRGLPAQFRRQEGLALVEDGLAATGADMARSVGSLLSLPARRRDRIAPKLRSLVVRQAV